MVDFRIVSEFIPAGDQPEAIDKLAEGLGRGLREQTLLGVTGSGKTFTMANVIARLGRPAIVIAHNKTLAAQLCSELKEFLPDNAVEYFVSYYDYYQPEAYLPSSDTYILPEPAQTKERRVDMTWDTETSPRILVSYHTPAQDLAKLDSAAQDVLGSLLLGEASKLHRELVLEKGLVEGLANFTRDHRDPHLFYYLVVLKDEKDRAAVLSAIDKEIASMAAGNVDEKLLADVKSRARYGVLTGLETPEDVASTIAVVAGASGDPRAIEKLLAQLEAVTAADVSAFAKKYLVSENRTVVNLASKGGAK